MSIWDLPGWIAYLLPVAYLALVLCVCAICGANRRSDVPRRPGAEERAAVDVLRTQRTVQGTQVEPPIRHNGGWRG